MLGHTVDFDSEIVVTDAKERHKSKSKYNADMTEFFIEANRVLMEDGYIALYFNARDKESWKYLQCIEEISSTLKFIGCFPMTYSATSVVQDNRKGAMKKDYIILYQKQKAKVIILYQAFKCLPAWSSQFPNEYVTRTE